MIKSLALSSFSSLTWVSLLGLAAVSSKIESKYKTFSTDSFLSTQQPASDAQKPSYSAWNLIYHSGSFSYLTQLLNQLNISPENAKQVASKSEGLFFSSSTIYPEKLQKLVNSFLQDLSWIKLVEPLEINNQQSDNSGNLNSLFPSFKSKFLSLNKWLEFSVFALVISVLFSSSLLFSTAYYWLSTNLPTDKKLKELLFYLFAQIPGWWFKYKKKNKKNTLSEKKSSQASLFNGGSISVSNLNYFKDKLHILKEINCEIKENEFYGIIGANGAGKTTLLKHLGKIIQAEKDKVFLSGKELSSVDNQEFWKKVVYIPQELNIQEDTPVYDFLLYSRFVYLPRYKKAQPEDHLKVLQAIKQCQIQHLRWSKIGALSGGQRQKVILASILVKDAELILLDEPTTFLDLDNRNFLIEFFKELLASGKTIISNLHKFVEVNQLATKIIALQGGRIQKLDTKEKVLTSDFLNNLFDLELSKEKWESLMAPTHLNY